MIGILLLFHHKVLVIPGILVDLEVLQNVKFPVGLEELYLVHLFPVALEDLVGQEIQL